MGESPTPPPDEQLQQLERPPPKATSTAAPTALPATTITATGPSPGPDPAPAPAPTEDGDAHVVTFQVKVDYDLEIKETELKPLTKGVSARVLNERATSAKAQNKAVKATGLNGRAFSAKGRGTSARTRVNRGTINEDAFRSFYVTYNIGSNCEAKSPNLPPNNNQWSCSHDIEVTTKMITDHFVGKQLEFQVYELVKVEVEKRPATSSKLKSAPPVSIEPERKEMNLANSGLTAQQLRNRAKAKLMASTFNEGSDENNAEKPHSSSHNADRKGGHQTHGKHENGPHESGDKTTSSARKSKRHLHNTDSSAADSTDDDQSRPETAHPHHYDHPERHLTPNSGKVRRTRSTISMANLTAMRPRTPPSPHHHNNPIATLIPRGSKQDPPADKPPGVSDEESTNAEQKKATTPGKDVRFLNNDRGQPGDSVAPSIADLSTKGNRRRSLSEIKPGYPTQPVPLTKETNVQDVTKSWLGSDFALTGKSNPAAKPRGKVRMVIETQKVLVAKASMDLTNFILGAREVEAFLPIKPDGLKNFRVTVSVDKALLSAKQTKALKPVRVNIVAAENMPKTPLPYSELDRLCSPTKVSFKFYNGSILYEAQGKVAHAENIAFEATHVIFTGLFNEDEFRNQLLSTQLLVEVHDRDPKPSEDISRVRADLGFLDPKTLTGPFGVARFDLSDMAKGETYLRRSSPILPGRRDEKRGFPPGLWLESGAYLTISVQTGSPLFDAPNRFIVRKAEHPFGRILLMASREDTHLSRLVETLVNEVNMAARDISETDPTEEEMLDTKLDIITGYEVIDDDIRFFFLEGLINKGLLALVNQLSKSLPCPEMLYFDPDTSYPERCWKTCKQKIVHILLQPSVDDVIHSVKTYIWQNIPPECYEALMIIQKLRQLDLFYRKSHYSFYPSNAMIESLLATFGSQITFEEASPTFFETSSESEQTPCNLSRPGSHGMQKPRRKLVDDRNLAFETWLKNSKDREYDVIRSYQQKFQAKAPPRVRDYQEDPVFNYSIQKLSSTELQVASLRQKLKKGEYLYSDQFNLSLPPLPLYTKKA
ncbi:hypothetical protein HDV05_002993 [Chytridiales sp. JEL 0842]|nr:hypothetical protein HDV05_002993 [Chytridiales sp. JEL 0842]